MPKPEGYRLPKVQANPDVDYSLQFREKFPGQVEQILRLVGERLQIGLRKDVAKPLTNSEVKDLSIALQAIYEIHREQC